MTERLPRVALVLLVTASLVVTLAGLRATAHIVGPAFLALVLTITVHPVRRRMVRRGMPEWLVSLAVLLSVVFLLLSVSLCTVFAIGRLAALLPTYIPDAEDSLADAGAWLADRGVGADQVEAVTSAFDFDNLITLATDIFGAAIGVVSDLVFIVTLALFMAFDTGAIQRVLDRVRELKPDLVDALTSFAKGTRTYMAVSAGFGLIVAVIDGVALQLMGVPGAFVWAVLAFVTNFIPNIGFVIGVIPPALIGLLEGGPGLMVGVLAVYCVINLIIQSIIQPRYVGDAVGLTPTITMLSLVFWAWALGPLGALLAVPLSLLMRALLIEADPAAAWAMPLISGHAPDPDAAPEPPASSSVPEEGSQTSVGADAAR
jgi:predicted PurR-regulated permease PerM